MREKHITGLMLAAALVFFACAALAGFTNEISHVHGFRQAQTLLAIRRMLEGGPWLWYELPVMGEPARLPHEFPLFHWLVALAHKATRIDLLVLCRALALAYWLGCLAVLRGFLGGLGFSRFAVVATLALALCSPLYVHWSRAAVGETQALFFALLFLESLRRRRWAWAAAFGAIAGLVKSLTLFAALPMAAYLLWRHRRERAVCLAAAVAGPVAAAVLWTWLADRWKLANPLAAEVLASRPLLADMIGPLHLRLDPAAWGFFWRYSLPSVVGSGWIFVALVVAALALRARLPLFLLAVFAAPFLVLMHIYSTHHYYPCAVAVWCLAALALVLDRLARSPRGFAAAVALLVAIFVAQASRFHNFYYPLQTIPNAYGRDLGRVLSELVRADELILVYGWSYSAEISYFSDRRTLMNPLGYPPEHPLLTRVLADQPPARIAAALLCLGQSGNRPLGEKVAAAYGLGVTPVKHRYADCEIYHRPGRVVPPGAVLF